MGPSITLLIEFCVLLAGVGKPDDVIEVEDEPKEGVGSIMNVPMENELYKPWLLVELLKEGVSKPGGGPSLDIPGEGVDVDDVIIGGVAAGVLFSGVLKEGVPTPLFEAGGGSIMDVLKEGVILGVVAYLLLFEKEGVPNPVPFGAVVDWSAEEDELDVKFWLMTAVTSFCCCC